MNTYPILALQDLLAHRRPLVTCISIHPAGHFFVVGHADGTIAFWAVEDEDHPLFVRTIDDLEEVNLVDGTKIEQYLPNGNVPVQDRAPPVDREPIFKLSWCGFPNSSDPRGGATALVILGGLIAGDSPGVTVFWLPAFNPPEPSPATTIQTGLHPLFRKAMRESLIPSKTFFYPTPGPTQDFLLVPRDNPHFAGAFDPVFILLTSDSVGDTRAVEASQFPPPEFLSPVSDGADDISNEVPKHDDVAPSDALDDLSEDLTSTLRAMSMTDDPKRANLPSLLWNGKNGVIQGQLVKLEQDAYETFANENQADDDELPLKGGTAWTTDAKANETKLSKVRSLKLQLRTR